MLELLWDLVSMIFCFCIGGVSIGIGVEHFKRGNYTLFGFEMIVAVMAVIGLIGIRFDL